MSAYGNLKNAERWQKLNERTFYARHKEAILTVVVALAAFVLLWANVHLFAAGL